MRNPTFSENDFGTTEKFFPKFFIQKKKFFQNSTGYNRYTFNGQEKDDEIAVGNYTAEFWEFDSRLGRRWNIDPVVKPWESSYATFDNSPIHIVDVNGNTGDDPNNNCGSAPAPTSSMQDQGTTIDLVKKEIIEKGSTARESVTVIQTTNYQSDPGKAVNKEFKYVQPGSSISYNTSPTGEVPSDVTFSYVDQNNVHQSQTMSASTDPTKVQGNFTVPEGVTSVTITSTAISKKSNISVTVQQQAILLFHQTTKSDGTMAPTNYEGPYLSVEEFMKPANIAPGQNQIVPDFTSTILVTSSSAGLTNTLGPNGTLASRYVQYWNSQGSPQIDLNNSKHKGAPLTN